MRAVRAQTRMEIVLTLRRGESLVVTMLIPVLFLVFFSSVRLAGQGVEFLAPGILALSIIATSMVSFGISTGYDRSYGVLKLLGGSPLTRGQLVVAKVASIVAVQVVQVVVVTGVALVLGWAPAGGVVEAAVVMLVGSATFAGLGMLMAGTLRAEATLALTNGLFVVFMMLGGILYPLQKLPKPLRVFAEALPAAAFGDSLRLAFERGSAVASAPFVILCLWGLVLVLAAVRRFRWE